MRNSFVALCFLSSPALAQGTYDFNHLVGTDPHPFTPVDGQDNWSAETFNAFNPCGVTETLSHDGTECLRFQEVGPGFGCDASRINDMSWGFPSYNGTEGNAYFQADMQVGFWGGSFGVAHDTNNNGNIRGSQMGERGVRFTLGTQSNVQFRLNGPTGGATQALLSTTSITGGDWVRVRVVMDLAANSGAGEGSVYYMNLSTGETVFTPVGGLQNVGLGLVAGSGDASDPSEWDAVWLHFEGATYGLDNIEVGTLDPGTPYCMANANSTGVPGRLRATGSELVAVNSLTLIAQDLPTNTFGFFLTSRTQGFVQNPAGSAGNLCLGGSIGRYVGPGQIQNSGAGGAMSLAIDLTQTPTPTGLVAVAAGQDWNFQAWYRDALMGSATSNFTNGLEIDFR